MRAGAAVVDITPLRNVELAGFRARAQPMTGVRDPLFARALAFDDGRGRAVMVVADVLGAQSPVVEAIQEQAAQRLGLAPEFFHIAGTHTHSAPAIGAAGLRDCGRPDPDYVRFFQERILACAGAALENMQPASLALSTSEAHLGSDRRREWLKLECPEQSDPEVLALWVLDAGSGAPFAVAVNYACHAVCFSDRLASADWPGAVCSALSQALGPGVTPLVLAGAGANTNPLNRGSADAVRSMAQTLASAVLAAPRKTVTAAPVHARRTVVSAPFLIPSEQDLLAMRREFLGRVKPGDSNADSTRLEWVDSRLADQRAGRLPPFWPAPVSVLAVGPVRFVFLPFETFAQTGLAIKRRSPGSVFVVSCADGLAGYLPVRAAFAEGGYEVQDACRFYDTLPFAPEAEERVVEAVCGMM